MQDEFNKWLDSLNDINLDSKPTIFDEQLLVDTFGNYFVKFENYKRTLERQYPTKKVNEIYALAEDKVGKNPLQQINEILQNITPNMK
ncbi:hypothetical protein [Helicobacter sp. MIT 14-3879]|uniref:hypothetical protein n=1 Tax=Helicobacter sp. MIT 14-3879 TaxID=2040649 RepID=UPI0011C0290E|nr:hypothetical protein [Helicobacter sp. MIT 14-3879]